MWKCGIWEWGYSNRFKVVINIFMGKYIFCVVESWCG